MRQVFDQLGLQVLERGWLSANNVLFRDEPGGGATVVDTGYDSHVEQTLALLHRALAGRVLTRVVNTHLHSDHCGGNAALQEAWGAETWVPELSLDAVRAWDTARLTHERTDQACRRFTAARGVAAGEELQLGPWRWQALSAPGHDPEALMFFQPDSRVLISGDALWEARVAIIFPELDEQPGFDEALEALDRIESLSPRVVIPGHGAPFTDVRAALAASRSRLMGFRADPRKHLDYGVRALTMFRMMALREVDFDELCAWLLATPVFAKLWTSGANGSASPTEAAKAQVRRLIDGGQLRRDGPRVLLN